MEYDAGKLASIRNEDGLWINTSYFSEAARTFQKEGFYTKAPYGSDEWREFWQRELKRTQVGYTVGGCRITGDHYYYLNYAPIKRTLSTNKRVAKKGYDFPDFWDGDYNYFHTLEIARNGISPEELRKLNLEVTPLDLDGGKHVAVTKARRKGFSFKNAALCVNRYNNTREFNTVIAAYDRKYLFPKGTMAMVHRYLAFTDQNTAWAKKRDYADTQLHLRASYRETTNGVTTEKGYMSEIEAVTFNSNPHAARGKSPELVLWEESGAFDNLLDAISVTKPAMEDGIYTTGQMVAFGCVCAGSKVWTHDGRQVNIEDLQQEEGIVGFDGVRTTKEPIIWMKPPAKKECVRIETQGGKFIECSIDHPLLWSQRRHTVDGKRSSTFKRADEVEVGDQLLFTLGVEQFGTEKMWEPRIVGMLIGDGNYTEGNTPQLSVAEPEVWDYVSELTDVSIYKQFQTKTAGIFRAVGLPGVSPILRDLGIYGQVRGDKTLPQDIHKYDEHTITELLGGYFDADGNVNYSKSKSSVKVVLTCKHKSLLEEVKAQLFKLGIDCYILKETRKKGYDGEGYVHRLYITRLADVLRFREKISLVCKHKQDALDKVLELGNSNRFSPIDRGFKVNPDNGKGSCYPNVIQNTRKAYVKSVTFIGEKNVYNLNAGLTHTYIANGFVTGNTGGDMNRGTVALNALFYAPETYNFIRFENIWDDDALGTTCSYFVPDYQNKIGYMDEQGNSDNEAAKRDEELHRKELVNTPNGATALAKRMQEHPHQPKEAFLNSNVNEFPVDLLQKQLNKIKVNKLFEKKGQPCTITKHDGLVQVTPDLRGILRPITEFPIQSQGTEGALVIFEHPVPAAPKGLYKIGYDPYVQDQTTGTSLGSIFVYKGINFVSPTRDMIVAEYTGRPSTPDDCHRIAELLAEYYGTTIMHENMVKDVESYFQRRKKLNLLSTQADSVINSAVRNSKVSRKFGIHMSVQIMDACEKYIKAWLLEEREIDEDGRQWTNVDFIYSPGLLEELIKFNRKKGNFDRVMALAMVMVQIQNDAPDHVYGEKNHGQNLRDFAELIKTKYNGRS